MADLSPRDLARALRVSDSTVRRWIDGGEIASTRTRGGHRRVSVAEAVDYARRSGLRIEHPEALGLELAPGEPGSGAEGLYTALVEGDAERARALILGAYLGGEELALVFDRTLRPALARLGELWKGGRAGILAEHRATAICVQALHALRALLPPADGPLALGGAVAGDPYVLPSLMAAAVLEAEGFQTVDLGADTPMAVFGEAIEVHRPELVWVTVGAVADAEPLRAAVRQLVRRESKAGVQFVFGGRELDALLDGPLPGATRADSMAELAALARGLRAAGGRARGTRAAQRSRRAKGHPKTTPRLR